MKTMLVSLSALASFYLAACQPSEQTDSTKKSRASKTATAQDGTVADPSTTAQESIQTGEEPADQTPANSDDAAADNADDPATPATPATFTLTSAAFQNNQRMPDQYVAKNNGGNMSPPLAWAGAPAGAASFAIQMIDLDFQNPPLIHWVITGIPATSKSLPAAIPNGNNLAAPAEAMGASQPRGAYRGPNPPNLHRYEFTIYAIKAGETVNIVNDSAANKTELEAKSLGKATIVGTYD